ncbi:MAG: 7-carboxy-7-deazaguanine synthase QueE, partial [Candidatus Omnitrophota bacterium]
MDDQGKISEIFSSFQGEGIYWGKKQIFVRFSGCNMHCVYCDEAAKTFLLPYETLSPEAVRERVLALEAASGPHHSVSLTGGEPLLYPDFLEKLLPRLKSDGFLLYLDTNGTCPDALARIIAWVDIIAMDIKLPSVTQDRFFGEEHRSFLEISRCCERFVKIVITRDASLEDFDWAVHEMARVDPKIPLVLQPV